MATLNNVNYENATNDIPANVFCNGTSLVSDAIVAYLVTDSTTSLSTLNIINNNNSNVSSRGSQRRGLGMDIQIPLYVVIFLLSLVGNILVIVTIIQNKKMRTVTNVFLLNLSLSDLLLAVFCMPFTLIPLLMKNFIFGEIMCVLIRYLQGERLCVN